MVRRMLSPSVARVASSLGGLLGVLAGLSLATPARAATPSVAAPVHPAGADARGFRLHVLAAPTRPLSLRPAADYLFTVVPAAAGLMQEAGALPLLPEAGVTQPPHEVAQLAAHGGADAGQRQLVAGHPRERADIDDAEALDRAAQPGREA